MDVKPADVFVGLLDFFSVLLPGAVFCFVCSEWAREELFDGTTLPQIRGGVQGWVVFAFASYLVGNFIFLLGSPLDQYLYDKWLRKRWSKKTDDRTYTKASAVKQAALADQQAEVVNTYKWALAYVRLHYPQAAAELHRLEADSKFFRSFVVMLVLLGAVSAFARNWEIVGISALLLFPSLWRYADQRWKSTELAYQYLIVLAYSQVPAKEPKPPPVAPPTPPAQPASTAHPPPATGSVGITGT